MKFPDELQDRSNLLYLCLVTLFCSILVVSNVIAAKIFYLHTFHLALPVGLITYPVTFLISDLVSEIFGPSLAKRMVYLGFAMTLVMVAIIQVALHLPPDPLWNHQEAFRTVFGANIYAVGGSLLAYGVSQVSDIYLFEFFRKWTRGRHLWLRNNASTLLSQILDTAIVSLVFLGWGLGLPLTRILPMILAGYLYKATFALLDTPFCYLGVYLAKRYLSDPDCCPKPSLRKKSSLDRKSRLQQNLSHQG